MIASEQTPELITPPSIPAGAVIEDRLQVEAMAAVIDLIDRLAGASSMQATCQQLAVALREYLECSEVYVGVPSTQDGPVRIVGISDSSQRSDNTQLAELADGVCEEVALRQKPAVWPPKGRDRGGLRIHRRLLEELGATELISVPLIDDRGVLRGVWLLVWREQQPSLRRDLFLRIAPAPIASLLEVIQRAEPHWLARQVSKLIRPGSYRRWQTVVASVALITLLMLIPVPHVVTCECELQPVTRRFVAPQFDGKLERSFVKPGDVVTRDQLLVKLDASELRMEQAALQAEHHRTAKKRDGELVERNFGAASVSRHELDRFTTKLELLEQRIHNLEIRSPIDGLVVTGDLQRAEGMPVTRGQSLLEIAPLDKLAVEIAIPEAEVRHVHEGMRIDISFESGADAPRSENLGRIHPRSEIRYDHHVFIAETELPNEQARLRPGMHGQARIHVGTCFLGWKLFHRVWERLTLMVGW
ncbi:MAG: efflux transporter, family, subunit [Planctomycetaceae bacterium]|nr:efflux transporter, family, subunit [Planctomycetaceae bacterium]